MSVEMQGVFPSALILGGLLGLIWRRHSAVGNGTKMDVLQAVLYSFLLVAFRAFTYQLSAALGDPLGMLAITDSFTFSFVTLWIPAGAIVVGVVRLALEDGAIWMMNPRKNA